MGKEVDLILFSFDCSCASCVVGNATVCPVTMPCMLGVFAVLCRLHALCVYLCSCTWTERRCLDSHQTARVAHWKHRFTGTWVHGFQEKDLQRMFKIVRFKRLKFLSKTRQQQVTVTCAGDCRSERVPSFHIAPPFLPSCFVDSNLYSLECALIRRF